MSALLAVEGLSARYGEIVAVRDASLRIESGEVIALLGANGAGKSTLIKAIMGLVPAVARTLTFRGQDLQRARVSDRARLGLGYSPEGRRVFPGMTVRENLAVASRRSSGALTRAIDQVFAIFPALVVKADAPGWQLSGGQQQMLAIARALMTEPQLLLLDEPSLGLSPLLTNEVIERVRLIREAGTAVLVAEQNVAKALAISDRAYVLQVGRVVAQGPARELSNDPAIRKAFLGA